MLYGIREICDVVLRAKGYQKIGNTVFHNDMPVLYFDSLKTSSLEGAATTVYAQGGRGNTRLIAWEGEKTITFTMEDALISPISLAVLSGAGVIEASEAENSKIKHATERAIVQTKEEKKLVGLMGGDPFTDPSNDFYAYLIPLDKHGDMSGQPVRIDSFATEETEKLEGFKATINIKDIISEDSISAENVGKKLPKDVEMLMIDYYYKNEVGTITQIDIDAQNFAGNYYLEASTLWRNKDGEDVSAEFIIPNCKIQSNFTFSMAATGDPSTFTFTMDAFPDFTKYDKTKKVLCAIRVDEYSSSTEDKFEGATEVPKNPAPAAAAAYRSWRSEATSTSSAE